ncbi:MAG: glycosyltransferase family 2 protein [Chlamydiae bacterium]|nr:glycosyltransferase family 2 protein [Chlamydiota bacterium]
MKNTFIVIVIPAYRVADRIQQVITSIPSFVQNIIVVNDSSPDRTEDVVLSLMAKKEPRLVYLKHSSNKGVGGAVCTGYVKALELGADIIVKMDGDGQMDPKYLKALINPLINGKADYAKGNRFYHIEELRNMPYLRLLGNGILGFFVRFSSGYWDIYDPTNGYTAIRSEILKCLNTNQIHQRYFYEISMLNNLGLLHARVIDVPIPARYGNEESSLKIWQVVKQFPLLLFKGFLKRLWIRHLLLELSVFGLFFTWGSLLFTFGSCYGIFKLVKSTITGIPSTSGAVMLSALPLILGFILLIQAIAIDIGDVPKIPLEGASDDIKDKEKEDK